MKNSKPRAIFSLGRRWLFTLALFVFVFAVASAVKIQAGTEHSAQGWMWGGGTGTSGDGTHTNVGWISANNLNQGGAVNYGVSIPSGTGDVSGYAWSENIGWISFNASDLSGCPQGQCKAERDGINLKGWARIMEIKLAGANAGGWQGWVSLKGPRYGVTINTSAGALQNYAWSDELGWIDFSRVSIVIPANTVTLEPASFYLRQYANPSQTLYVTVRDQSNNPVSGKTVNFSNSNAGRFSLSAPSCVTGGTGECTASVSASDFTSTASTTITTSCPDCSSDSSTGNIIQTLNCIVSCPSSVEVVSGATKDYDVTISGPAGCNSLDNCSKISGSSDVSVSQVDGNTCRVTAANTTRYGSAVSRASAGTGQCDTNVNIKGPGWVETNP